MQHWFTYPTNIDPVAIHLGPLRIHWYGIAYLVAFVCVYLWMSRPAGRRRLGLTREQIQDFLFYALIGVLVGGRTFFVINDIISKHDASFYFSNPINFIAVWNGGMAFHGGLIGVLVAIWLFDRKHPGLKYTVVGDEVVMMLPIGIALVPALSERARSRDALPPSLAALRGDPGYPDLPDPVDRLSDEA
jgi:phosphatidylglycerol---prolipoprotein diacylglyceryl transferase